VLKLDRLLGEIRDTRRPLPEAGGDVHGVLELARQVANHRRHGNDGHLCSHALQFPLLGEKSSSFIEHYASILGKVQRRGHWPLKFFAARNWRTSNGILIIVILN
jgi:hypothetical protein